MRGSMCHTILEQFFLTVSLIIVLLFENLYVMELNVKNQIKIILMLTIRQ